MIVVSRYHNQPIKISWLLKIVLRESKSINDTVILNDLTPPLAGYSQLLEYSTSGHTLFPLHRALKGLSNQFLLR